jgi:hypothetical protein
MKNMKTSQGKSKIQNKTPMRTNLCDEAIFLSFFFSPWKLINKTLKYNCKIQHNFVCVAMWIPLNSRFKGFYLIYQ